MRYEQIKKKYEDKVDLLRKDEDELTAKMATIHSTMSYNYHWDIRDGLRKERKTLEDFLTEMQQIVAEAAE